MNFHMHITPSVANSRLILFHFYLYWIYLKEILRHCTFLSINVVKHFFTTNKLIKNVIMVSLLSFRQTKNCFILSDMIVVNFFHYPKSAF